MSLFLCRSIRFRLFVEQFSLRSRSKSSMSNYHEYLSLWSFNGEKPFERTFPHSSPLSSSSSSMKDLKLIGAQICFRHGARTPLRLLKGLEEVTYRTEHFSTNESAQWDVKLITKLGNNIVEPDQIISADEAFKDKKIRLKSEDGKEIVTGQLTSIGEKQLFQLGQQIQKDLFPAEQSDHWFLPPLYHPNYVYCRSTYMSRTIASARSFLAGLFTFDHLEKKIQSTGPFQIEVHHFPDEDMFPNPKIYPILKECHTPSFLYQTLNDHHQLKKAREELIRRLDLGHYSYGIVDLADDFVSRKAHGFSVPEDLKEIIDQFESFSAREFVAIACSIDVDLFLRSTCGPLLTLIKQNFDSIHQNYLQHRDHPTENAYQRLFIYSGHDTTLIPLAMALEIFDMRWPPYGSHLMLRYYVSKSNENQGYVTVQYGNQIEPSSINNEYLCPYSAFVKNIENRCSSLLPRVE